MLKNTLNNTFSSFVTATTTTSQPPPKQPYICSDVSPYTLWELYGSNTLRMLVDTRSCYFNSTPTYFTTLAGLNKLYRAMGINAIYVPTKNSFAVYILPFDGSDIMNMLDDSQIHKWNLNWVGIIE